MARKPRVEFEDAFYHVIAGGNQRQDLFRHDKNRAIYLERLGRIRVRLEYVNWQYDSLHSGELRDKEKGIFSTSCRNYYPMLGSPSKEGEYR